MSKRVRILALLTVFLLLLSGCGKSSKSYSKLISNFRSEIETKPLPPSALEAMTYLIENYSGGVRIPTVKKIRRPPPTEPTDAASTDKSKVNPSETPTSATEKNTKVEPTDTTADDKDNKKKQRKTPTEPSNSKKKNKRKVPYAICHSLKEAKENELYYLKSITPRFKIIVESKKDYSDELGSYIFDDFTMKNMFESMFLKAATYYYSSSGSTYTYEFVLTYQKPISTVKKDIKLAKEALENCSKKLNMSGMSDYEKVKTVNEYLCDAVYYPKKQPYSPESHTVYGTLCQGCAVCEGYARTAKAIFDLNGVSNYYVEGNTTSGGHAWNLVKVDGNWYQLDITWNDAGNNRKEYFLVTDGFMRYSRAWNEKRYPHTPNKPYKKQ